MKKSFLIRAAALAVATVFALSPVLNAYADEGDEDKIETELTPLRDAVSEVMGDDIIVGAACTKDELSRKAIQKLIEHHFNAVTFGNELKPDALFGYSNGKVPGTHTDELNGKEITVPNMDFSRAEYMCEIIYKWNQENPDRPIKIRGHVLVWHSQTPEWFFHEDYDKTKPYVTPDEMNIRLEWYIREVLTHFTGEDSKYKGMFYGWDVVNEAISDGTKSYRTDTENASEQLSRDTHGSNSSWWHVYGNEQFIINAFKYANKYAPADLDLYYNDYNDTDLSKAFGIVKLIEAVKADPDTRIDGMGMQGHYNSNDMNDSKFETCAKKYLETGVKVMITEWDLKSDNYDPNDEANKVTEYTRQAHRYEAIYKKLIKLQENGYDIAGFTFWGTIDKLSWLQTQSNVGGGSTTGNTQCPLLFDDDYHAKPAYWAFVDADKINDMQKAFKEKEKAEKESAASTEDSTETSVDNKKIDVEVKDVDAEIKDVEVEDIDVNVDVNVDDPAKEKPHKRSTPMIIATCAVIAAIVFAGSLATQKYREKHGPKKKRSDNK